MNELNELDKSFLFYLYKLDNSYSEYVKCNKQGYLIKEAIENTEYDFHYLVIDNRVSKYTEFNIRTFEDYIHDPNAEWRRIITKTEWNKNQDISKVLFSSQLLNWISLFNENDITNLDILKSIMYLDDSVYIRRDRLDYFAFKLVLKGINYCLCNDIKRTKSERIGYKQKSYYTKDIIKEN